MMDVRDAFFEELYKIAQEDKNVVFLTADMGAWGLTKFKEDMPDRYFNVGIAEQNLINVSAGLTLAGKNVFAYAIAPFITYRCYEQIKVNLCDNKLGVTLIGAGPGLTYKTDGPSHHCVFDIPIMQVLPVTILTPRSEEEARQAVRTGYENKMPTYVRLGRGEFPSQYGQYTDPYYDVPLIYQVVR